MAVDGDAPAAGDDGQLWLSIADVAGIEKKSRQAISKRVAALIEAGKLTSKPGPRGTKLVNLFAFRTAIGATGDAAKEAGAATKAAAMVEPLAADPALPLDAPAAPGGFRDAQTREKQIAAYLKELELRERLGQLVPVAEIEDAALKVGEAIIRVIDRIGSHADAVAASVAKEGTLGARARLKDIAREIRAAVAVALRDLAKLAPAPSSLDALDALALAEEAPPDPAATP